MAEKKEAQWAVLKQRLYTYITKTSDGIERSHTQLCAVPASIVWFDSRSEARNYVKSRPASKVFRYNIARMTRGPRA